MSIMDWHKKVLFFSCVELEDVPRTKAGRDFWREIGQRGMRSELGQYTPDEFYILLDYIDELEEKLSLFGVENAS